MPFFIKKEMFMKKAEGFSYIKTSKRYVCNYSGGVWEKGRLIRNASVTLNESACVLQYAQTCFEGLKAYRTDNGHIVCFRPDLNEKRLADSCRRMVIPPLPDGMFTEAVKKVVLANRKWIPDADIGSLYIRPFIFGQMQSSE